MNPNAKRWAVAVLVLLQILLLAGCGGGTSPNGATSSAGSTVTAKAASNPSGGSSATADSTHTPNNQHAEEDGAIPLTPAEAALMPVALPPAVLHARGVKSQTTIPFTYYVPSNLLPPVADQGDSGACGPFALGYVGATFVLNENTPGTAADPARQYGPAWLYAHVLQLEGKDPCIAGSRGTKTVDDFDTMINQGGLSVQACPFPDNAHLCAYMENLMSANLPPNPAFKIGGYSQVTLNNTGNPRQDTLPLRQMVAAGQPVEMLVQVPAEQTSWYNRGPNEVMTELAVTDSRHFMAIVGYNDTITYTTAAGQRESGAVYIQNSRGPSFGCNGYYWMSYELLEYCMLNAWVEWPTTATGPLQARAEMNVAGKASAPAARVRDAWQAADASNPNTVFLVSDLQFDTPVTITGASLTSPTGQTVSQSLHWCGSNGPMHFSRHDGHQFTAGNYTLQLTTADNNIYTATFTVGTEVGLGSPADFPADMSGTAPQPLSHS